MKQCVKILFGIEKIEERINNVIADMNTKGWKLTQVISHYSKQSNWCLIFEKKTQKGV